MRFQFFLFLNCLFLSAVSHAQNEITVITVITDKQHLLSNTPIEANIIYLDQAIILQNTLSNDLPASLQEAEKIAKSRLTSFKQQALFTALQGALDAWSLGITKIPAVVVNKKYVVYGETDVNKALITIHHHINNEIRNN